MENKLLRSSFVKFLLVGVINTAVGTAVMFLLYNLAEVPYWPSVCANYLCEIGRAHVSYFLNKYFTFQNTERSLAQAGRFVVTVAVCMVVAYGIAKPAVRLALTDYGPKVQENVAMVVGMGLYTLLNYFGQRFFAFRKSK